MKNLVNYFRKGQLSKLFFCFPDPHFKKSNWRRRIINESLLASYAFLLKEGGLLYTVTDVYDLHIWMRDTCAAHPLFIQLTTAELEGDPCVSAIQKDTEESMKVTRGGYPSYTAVFKRII
eukprot:GHVR01178160.1.p1 GENE.GHVR01178160.1~~GHVR01178160.1.p1  ORF type:complete len:120 (-),score=21.63 GHVR01178160.1:7-366(-)